jgi:hypothetical protein
MSELVSNTYNLYDIGLQQFPICHVTIDLARLNISISEGGTCSSCTHNLVKSQSYRGLKLLLSDTKSTTMVYIMFIYHIIQEY